MRNTIVLVLTAALLALGIGGREGGGAQAADAAAVSRQGGRGAAAARPPALFFRESFSDDKTLFMARPLQTTDVTNPTLELKMYGPGAVVNPDRESGIELDSANPDPVTGTGLVSWVWTGMTEGPWVVTLRDKDNFVDLSGLGRIRWRVRMRGFNELRPVVKLADGTMLVGDYTEAPSTQWRVNEFFLVDVPRWRALDPKAITGMQSDAAWKTGVNLSRVDEVGFTDLMRGGGHGLAGNSGVDFIEVYGTPVKR